MSTETIIAIAAVVLPIVGTMIGAALKIASVGGRLENTLGTLSIAVTDLGGKLEKLNEDHANTRERVARIEGGQNRGGN